MRALVDGVLSKYEYRSASAASALVKLVDSGGADKAIEYHLGQATQSVRALLPSDNDAVRALNSVVERLDGAKSGAVQVLCSPEVAERHRMADYVTTASHRSVDVRLTGAVAHGALIIDGRVALLPCALGTKQSSVTVIRASAVLKALEQLFTGAWQRAVPLLDYQRITERIRHDFAQDVLRCLGMGWTDEAAARELSVSVRTYRRHVSEIMQVLGVSSRFQAGAQAAELGLLPSAVRGVGPVGEG
ncbi:transcriptional regulator [Streptomyces sp. NPDC002589]|uniref:helix-turn-helix transcriptional regulator n=1 Tax=Streptomyces sp. NPDC002589 TaxID=3154420 RepID=UPI00332340FB